MGKEATNPNKQEADRMTIEDAKAKLAKALAGGKDEEIDIATAEYKKARVEAGKAEAVKIQEDNAKLLGAREKLAVEVHGAIKGMGLESKLGAVKATGFTFKLDTEELKHKSVALLVPEVKVKRASGGNGGAGKTKDDYGMTLSEVVAKFGSSYPELLKELAEAEAKDAGTGRNSNEWRVKDKIKKQAIADGKLAPAK